MSHGWHTITHTITFPRASRLLDKNKDGFATATTPSVETLLPATAAGGGNEAIILKRLRARSFRNADVLTPEDKKFAAAVHQIIADGRVGKATIRKVKEAFDKTDDPVAMLAILRKDIARQYLVGAAHKPPLPKRSKPLPARSGERSRPSSLSRGCFHRADSAAR